jgi:tetratricopeptide (TPR) repeat protein
MIISVKIVSDKLLRFTCLALVMIMTFFSAHAAGEEQLVDKGNKAYAAEKYADAIDAYKQVISQGYESPELYYNLGNAYFKANQVPSAILFFEKARRLDPGNEDIDFNLKVANNKIADKIEPIPELFYVRWFHLLTDSFSFDGWARIAVGFFLLGLIMGGGYYASRRLLLRKIGFWTALVSLGLFLLTTIFALTGYARFHHQNEAIIFAPTITVKSSPNEKAIDLFVIHEGTKVKILDGIGSWLEIRIPNGSVGWLPATAVEKI